MKIKDDTFAIENVRDEDVFVCTEGHEKRSRYLLDMLIRKRICKNILVLAFDDLIESGIIGDPIKYESDVSITVKRVKYEQGYDVANIITSFVIGKAKDNSRVWIDYSSMPRRWYSSLPLKLNKSVKNKTFFLYVVGEYIGDYTGYPSAGIESYSLFAGRPSLRVSKRLHIIGVGYDSTRTEGLISILNPDMYLVCSGYYSKDEEMEQRVQEVNKHILDQAFLHIGFLIDDVSYMVARLCEIAIAYLPFGDVVFVPDGPKPLIMAMSLVPQILKQEGVVCLHVSRNPECFELVEVEPTNNVICFTLQNEENDEP